MIINCITDPLDEDEVWRVGGMWKRVKFSRAGSEGVDFSPFYVIIFIWEIVNLSFYLCKFGQNMVKVNFCGQLMSKWMNLSFDYT